MKLLTISNQLLDSRNLGHAGVYTATKWLAEMFKQAGVEVFEIGFGTDGQNFTQRLSVSAATSMLVAGEIDAIYCQYVEDGAPFDLAAMSPHVIPVLSVGHDLFNAMPPLRAYLSSNARHSSDAIIFSSEAGAKAFRRMIAHTGKGIEESIDIHVLPLGVTSKPEKQRSPVTGEEVVYLWLGRFSETYKADLRPLLLAFREVLNRSGPAVRLVLAGADVTGLVEHLQVLAKKMGIDKYCTWYPNASDDVRDACLTRSDVLVNVSDHVQETFGLVNIEAMARGIPVIAGTWSGFREVIVHGMTGLLVPMTLDASFLKETVGDPHGSLSLAAAIDIPALVEAMIFLRESEFDRWKMGAAGRQRVETVYATEVLAPKYVQFVEERILLAKTSGSRMSPRVWMPDAFSHFGMTASGPLKKGLIEPNLAYEIVLDMSLRRSMQEVFKNWREGSLQKTTGLDSVALATLIKLGVLRWSNIEEVKSWDTLDLK